MTENYVGIPGTEIIIIVYSLFLHNSCNTILCLI